MAFNFSAFMGFPIFSQVYNKTANDDTCIRTDWIQCHLKRELTTPIYHT